ncbi:MAG: glycyl-radical enzyme activating protein [Clostridia bacterium]|nr:glycyl-radical enzyme activating protein [Clostridia bacterium]
MNRSILSTPGRIADIQRFSLHDGPGIRTIVFLKGCHFRCRWCCNPEMQSYDIQTMMMDGKPKVVGRDVTVGEVIQEVLKDRDFFWRSGGGMTLSGGECLSQPDFAAALLEAAKNEGLNTAIESTAYAPFEVIERILPHLDFFLMDIKHMNSAKHKEYIGKGNEEVLANAKRLAPLAKRLIVRVPTIPGFNDSPAEIEAIARFAATLDGVEEIHLLPYHRLGQDKYRWLDRPYTLTDILPPPEEHMQELLHVAERSGLRCQIGG